MDPTQEPATSPSCCTDKMKSSVVSSTRDGQGGKGRREGAFGTALSPVHLTHQCYHGVRWCHLGPQSGSLRGASVTQPHSEREVVQLSYGVSVER